jgi:hypothetical protein
MAKLMPHAIMLIRIFALTEILYATGHKIFLQGVIHEHDFLIMGTYNHFIQCRTCDAVYCILCGKRIATAVMRGDHGVGKCIRRDLHRPVVPFK